VSSPGAALATVISLVSAVRCLSPEKGGQVPAITLSGCPLVGDRLEAWRAAGFQGHWVKPFDAAKPVVMVDRLAGQAVELHP
jgi:CheY-like chemotaxis protein